MESKFPFEYISRNIQGNKIIPWEAPLNGALYRLKSTISVVDLDRRCYSSNMKKDISYNTPALKQKLKNREIVEYITGFVDGEGCFSIILSKRKKMTIGWEVKPSFSVSQNYDRAEVLFLIQDLFNAGHLRRDYSNKTLKFEIRKLADLLNKIIPHFDKYQIISGKRKDFELFKQVCMIVKNNQHTNLIGLKKIIDLAFKMNPSTRRKYSKQEILNFAKFQKKI